MIRVSKHSLKFANEAKQKFIQRLFKQYKEALQIYIDLIIHQKLPFKHFLSSKLLPDTVIKHSRFKQVVYKNAAEIIFSNLNYTKNKTFNKYKKVYKKCIQQGKHQKFTNKHYKQLNINYLKRVKVNINKINITLEHRIRQLTLKRNNKINDYFHKVSHYLINQAVSNDVQTIIVGHNKDWKQEINNGKVNNQNFVFIPFDKLISQLKYKGKLAGINVVEVQQSYTSKCSSFDNQQLKHHDPYLGKRVKRGLFKTVSGKLINADINGSLNIMRKYCKCNCDVIFKQNNQQV